MGRTYIVEDAVEEYLTKQCEQKAAPVTGLLIGQSSTQREYVVMATRTPQREESTASGGKSLDQEWVTEHARQVSRMLPGGLSVLGVFIVTDDAKDTPSALRQLVFAVENLISSERLWNPAEDDVSDRVGLHVNPKTRKTSCRTFDTKDPKSVARPADWKYQSGVSSSWSTVACCLSVDVLVPLPDSTTATEDTDRCLKEGLRAWAQQLDSAVCLINGSRLAADTELAGGQKRNTRQTYSAQLLITSDERRGTNVAQRCGGRVSVRGAVCCTAYLHSNKPKARLAEKLLKRDAVSTVTTRAQMLLEELLTAGGASEGSSRDKHQREQFCLPHRVFCPVAASGPVCVCDYHFSDEGLSEVIDRLKEMLDVDAAEKDLDTRRETPAERCETDAADVSSLFPGPTGGITDALRSKWNYFGAAMATAVALLATAASMLYLTDV